MTTIYHNPRCSKSRQTLSLIEAQGISPTIIHYLDTPPDACTLTQILQKLGLGAREIIRTGEAAYKEQQLDDASLSETALIEAMIAFPKLIERPIVVKGEKAILGRPPENVLTLLT
ncbi:MAG: arsenate reductase [Kiritimatiellia bacterium]|jgi:arsenate reductase